MKYNRVEIINPDFYKHFVTAFKTPSGKKALEKIEWYLESEGFDKDAYVNAYRCGASDLLKTKKKWSDPKFSKQLKERKLKYDKSRNGSNG